MEWIKGHAGFLGNKIADHFSRWAAGCLHLHLRRFPPPPLGTFSARELPLLQKVRCSDFRHLLPRHSHNNIAGKPSFDFYDSSSPFAGPSNLVQALTTCRATSGTTIVTIFVARGAQAPTLLNPISCLAFCLQLDDHSQAFIRTWPAPFTSVVQHCWITCSSKANKRNVARTLVPTSLWSALQVSIPALAASAHRLELNSALVKPRTALKDALYHAHDWFRDNPQPWDTINWAHPLTAINPCRVPHGPYSTSTPPTILRAKRQ